MATVVYFGGRLFLRWFGVTRASDTPVPSGPYTLAPLKFGDVKSANAMVSYAATSKSPQNIFVTEVHSHSWVWLKSSTDNGGNIMY